MTTGRRICPKCGEDNPDNSRYCTACGASLAEQADLGQGKGAFRCVMCGRIVSRSPKGRPLVYYTGRRVGGSKQDTSFGATQYSVFYTDFEKHAYYACKACQEKHDKETERGCYGFLASLIGAGICVALFPAEGWLGKIIEFLGAGLVIFLVLTSVLASGKESTAKRGSIYDRAREAASGEARKRQGASRTRATYRVFTEEEYRKLAPTLERPDRYG